MANWLADRFLKDGFSIQCDKDTVWKGQTYDEVYWDNIRCFSQYATSIILNPNFHSANLADVDGVRNLLAGTAGPASRPVIGTACHS